ncbi:hypothetical protein CP533_3612 [Ophiocordyceps camponoti-saundersi (nom. inval.)]|nr:hypothetical protein CP533_3612 [Ophiocordyceps camponoti-saundersi (nom. inval.)]
MEHGEAVIYEPPDIPADPQYPFFSQTVSLYKCLLPQDTSEPVTGAEYQHLAPLVDKYVPQLRGVLLKYDKVTLGPAPGRRGAASNDNEPTTLITRGEGYHSFAWITADVELFMPRRGYWMEGDIILHAESQIGVVCYGKYNASIEAARLPPPWKWLSEVSDEAKNLEKTTSSSTAAEIDNDDAVEQVDCTGFWVDDRGARVQGKVRFRIRNVFAGASQGINYLSLEGTMLDEAHEQKLLAMEAEKAEELRQERDRLAISVPSGEKREAGTEDVE